jgi:hypothetical protein
MPRIEGISSFSTTIKTSTKDLLDRFCKKRGLRMNYIVETAILEFLEDEMDKEIIEKRELEETVAWKQHG